MGTGNRQFLLLMRHILLTVTHCKNNDVKVIKQSRVYTAGKLQQGGIMVQKQSNAWLHFMKKVIRRQTHFLFDYDNINENGCCTNVVLMLYCRFYSFYMSSEAKWLHIKRLLWTCAGLIYPPYTESWSGIHLWYIYDKWPKPFWSAKRIWT